MMLGTTNIKLKTVRMENIPNFIGRLLGTSTHKQENQRTPYDTTSFTNFTKINGHTSCTQT